MIAVSGKENEGADDIDLVERSALLAFVCINENDSFDKTFNEEQTMPYLDLVLNGDGDSTVCWSLAMTALLMRSKIQGTHLLYPRVKHPNEICP